MALGRIVRGPSGAGIAAPAEPCVRCGVRADVGCKHRPAEGVAPLAIIGGEVERKRRKPPFGNGMAFNDRRRLASNVEAARRTLEASCRDD